MYSPHTGLFNLFLFLFFLFFLLRGKNFSFYPSVFKVNSLFALLKIPVFMDKVLKIVQVIDRALEIIDF